jgi:nicotinamide-nucleotide amidase
VLAAILTIGNEIVSGDTPNTNASWIARQLEPLGVKVVLIAAVPDVEERIVEFVRRELPRVDHLLVTGGLGGTPDDITRAAIAAAFDVPQELIPELADDLRARFTGNPDYVTPWAALPRGARPLENPLGGAPGFELENVWVFPGLPREMEAMFLRYADTGVRAHGRARARDAGMAERQRRLVPAFHPGRAGGRGRAQVVRSGPAAGGRGLYGH